MNSDDLCSIIFFNARENIVLKQYRRDTGFKKSLILIKILKEDAS